MQNDTKVALAFGGVAVSLLVVFALVNGRASSAVPAQQVVHIENGIQVIDLTAKGGFSPSVVRATAGMSTELRVATNGTYDCSSVLVIPELGYQETLDPTGVEIIALAPEQAVGTLEGKCGMGMYDFEIMFI